MKTSPLKPIHDQIFQSPPYNALDHHFAKKMMQLAGQESLEIYVACGLVCHQTFQGNVCLNLNQYAERPFQWQDAQENTHTETLPPLEEWKEHLLQTPLVSKHGGQSPLILEITPQRKHLLYLNRYWQYENRLATSISDRLKMSIGLEESLLAEGLERLFPKTPEKDLQREAAEMALRHRFCVISGGPGTGKTTTVIRILALLIKQNQGKPFQIALAAPTGKAAARLKESIRNGRQSISGYLSEAENTLIPEDASTLHRLLGAKQNSVYFRKNQENLLLLDCLVVDEASMIDLALMSKLLDALPQQTRLILLGDKNQLSSVEAGSVLGDLYEDFKNKPKQLQNSIAHLQKSYRFDDKKGIGCLSREILQKQTEAAWNLLQSDQSELKYAPLPDISELKNQLKQQVLPQYQQYFAHIRANDMENAFLSFQSFIILSSLRKGSHGSQALNFLIEELLSEEKIIAKTRPWYAGRPIMITRNDYALGLYNGDIGLLLPDPKDGQLRAFFETDQGFRGIVPTRLSEHETVFAMTVHKSQGSEFDKILLILSDSDKESATRELLYTGLTRTRHSITLWTTQEIFEATINKRTHRNSGLQEKLAKIFNSKYPPKK